MLIGIACLLLPASAAAAPPVTNTNNSGSGSLRFAIGNATPSDTIAVPPGTYNISSELLVDVAMTIDGAGAGATIIDAGGNSRIFRVQLPVGAGVPSATIQDVTVRGGAAPSNTSEGGGGILNAGSGTLTVDRSVISGNNASSPGGSGSVHGGGGISNESGGGLNISNSTISGNTLSYGPGGSSNGGGGVHSATGDLLILNSTISGNSVTSSGSVSSVGGGGVYGAGNSLQIGNSTISGNTATVPSGGSNGGGGILVNVSQFSDLLRITLAGNTTNGAGGGLLSLGATPGIAGSLVSGNSPNGCAASVTTVGNNAENGNSCGFSNTANDLINTDPQLGPLEDSGGPTPTHAIPPGSPVIDVSFCGQTLLIDQRGVARPKGNNCEPGAYEFDGLSSVPAGCSRTGNFPVTLFPPAGSSATAARFRIDGGAEASAAASGNAATLQVPPGAHSLEFWGDFSPPTGGQEFEHHLRSLLVDPTGPLLRIASDQRRNGYTVGETASFSVRASDALSGLASDPTASRRPIDTRRAHSVTIRRTARDNCGNETSGGLRVTVLAKPVFGKRVNLIRLSGRVLVSLPGGGPSAAGRTSQKGRKFIPIQQARQVPVGSLIDTRKGRVRLVSARDPRARRLQAGQFYSGLFQVLQSRKKRAKGLTELRLKGANFRRCNPRRGRGAGAAQSRRALRRLRANARGRFRTRGRYSAATVRGTIWTTTDRCDGTLTRVSRGRVAVRDFRRRKTILVRRGKSYLATALVR